jgi:hypothetical protein
MIRMIKSRRLRWVGHAAHMGEIRNRCKILSGKPEGNRLLRRHRYMWDDDDNHNNNKWIFRK